MKRIFVAIAILVLAVFLCDLSSNPANMTMLSGATPGTPSVMQGFQTALAVQATSAARDTATALAENGLRAEETLQSAKATADVYARLATGTREAINAAQTQVAVRETQMAYERQVQMTMDAESTAVERAWVIQGWTATADMANSTATANAQSTRDVKAADERRMELTATQSMLNITATSQVVSMNAVSTLRAAQSESAALAVDRDRMMNNIRAAAPWAGLAALSILFGWAMVRFVQAEARKRSAIPPDPHGDKQIVPVLAGGKQIFLDLDKSHGPAVVVDKKGNVSVPSVTPMGEQGPVTARDQAIDLVNRGLPGASKRPLPKALAAPPINRDVDIEIVDPQSIKDILDEVESKLLMGGTE